MSLAMFGIVAQQVDLIAVLNNSIQGAVNHQLAHEAAQQAMASVNSQWQALRAQFDPNLGMLTDSQATQYMNALQNILNRVDAIIAQDGGIGVTSFTPAAVAGGSGGLPGMTDYSKYVTPGTTTANPMPNPRLDPTKPGPDKTEVHLSTADHIKQISDSIFGAVSSGAKQIFEIKAMQQASRGQPVYVPNTPASQSEMGTGTKLAIGGVAVVGIGLLIFALARK